MGTYHMPCLFNIRPVMVIHTSLVIKHLAGLAGSDPLVFAGDFNFNPDSECYKLAVEGEKIWLCCLSHVKTAFLLMKGLQVPGIRTDFFRRP